MSTSLSKCAPLPYRQCGVIPPQIVSPPVTKSGVDGWIYQVVVKDFNQFEPGSTITVTGVPDWATFNPATMTLSGIPPGDLTRTTVYDMVITATNSNGSDQQPLVLVVTVAAATARWGRSVLDVIGELEVLAFGQTEYKARIDSGSYQFSEGQSPYEYLYIWTEDTLGEPGNKASGRGWYSGQFQSSMAGPESGYTLLVNGWYCLPLVVAGEQGKLWRTLNPSIAAQDLVCKI